MSRLLTKLTVLAALAAPLIGPGVAFAQVCSPVDSSMNQCPPINDGGGARNDLRPDQMRPNGPDGMHPGKAMSGNPGAHATGGGFGGVGEGAHAAGGGVGGGALPGGAGPSGGMGHGGPAGGAAGGMGHGGGAGGAGGGGHGK
jgi:hypothetical protein